MNEQYSDVKNGVIFPRGEKNDAFARYFTGTSYAHVLPAKEISISNITFEPGCRNFWHTHVGGGQILLATGGHGWYQEWGKPARELHAGDVVNIPAGVKHWHGATKDSWFVHLAISVPVPNATVEWHDEVTEKEYAEVNKS